MKVEQDEILVGAVLAVNRVPAVRDLDQVVTGAPVDLVVARSAGERVVSATAVNSLK